MVSSATGSTSSLANLILNYFLKKWYNVNENSLKEKIMEIYVRVHSEDDGSVAWWNSDNRESYLMDGKELEAMTEWGEEYLRGTPFNNIKAALKAGKEAKSLAGHDGMVDPKVTFWRMVGGKLIETKFTRDGKIKR